LKDLFVLVVAIIICGALNGCASDRPDATKIDIRVEHLVDAKAFRVVWRTAGRADALVFMRGLKGSAALRSRFWTTKRSDQTIERIGNREIIRSKGPTQEFEVLIPEQLVDVDGDYPQMMSFSDGGVALYSGHLDAIPVLCSSVCRDLDFESIARGNMEITLSFVPAFGERVVSSEGQSITNLSFRSPAFGTFVYFGRTNIVRRVGYTVIADPALPSWILFELDRLFPQLLRLNARKFGRGLDRAPLIFIPFKSGTRRFGLTHSGAVLGDQLLLGLFGPSWSELNDSSREDFLALLAHETFHFWNATLYHSVDRPGGRWLHEGSAEAFSYLALLETGTITRERYDQLETEALNRCLVGLADTTLPQSNGSFTSRNYYTCGAIIQALAQRALVKRNLDLWKLWARLFQEASKSDGFYTHDQFLALTSELAGSELAAKLSALVSGGAPSPESDPAGVNFFIETYSLVGSVLAASDKSWPEWYHRLVGERALTAAIESDCGAGGGYFVSGTTGVRLVGGSWCHNLSDERQVLSVGGRKLWGQGVQVYDYIRNECRFKNVFNVVARSGRRRAFDLFCPRLPSRPLFLQIQTLDGLENSDLSATMISPEN
jgi:hypothetical protein